jgi:hypothetical protein
MALTQVEPYVLDTTASFTVNNLTITSVTANNTAGTLTTGATNQVLTSTGTNKAVWTDMISPFMLMGA